MKCETIIELSPDELAELVQSHLRRQAGLEVKFVALKNESDQLVSFAKVVVTAECDLSGHQPVGRNAVESRLAELQRRQAENLGAADAVEPFRFNEEPGRPSAVGVPRQDSEDSDGA